MFNEKSKKKINDVNKNEKYFVYFFLYIKE